MKQVIIDAAAEDELASSVEFYEARKFGLGLEFERFAGKAVQTIQSDPARNPLQKDGTRRLVMEQFPFRHPLCRIENHHLDSCVRAYQQKTRYWRRRL